MYSSLCVFVENNDRLLTSNPIALRIFQHYKMDFIKHLIRCYSVTFFCSPFYDFFVFVNILQKNLVFRK